MVEEGKFVLETLADLRPAPFNPRAIDDDALLGLRSSLKTFGDISGIVWNTRSGHMVAGHQRMKALRRQYGEGLRLDLAA